MPAARAHRPLLGLVGAQTVGMFNDNVLKMVVLLLLVGPRRTEAAQQTATFWGFLAYTLPYVLLSVPGGMLADAFSKRRVLLALKTAEMGVVALAGWALWDGRAFAVLGVLSMMGVLAAVGSPTKYGLLPELLPEERLARGNGLFVLLSWIATILGTGLAGFVLDALEPRRRWELGIGLGALAAAGWLFARRVPPVPAAGGRYGLVATARAGWQEIRSSRSLRLAVQGSATFWTLGALLQQDVIVYSKSELGLSDTGKGLMQAALAVGIGAGGLLCGFLTRGHLGTHWIPRGASAMGLLLVALGLLPPNTALATALLFLVGVASGLIVVPLNSLAQGRSPPQRRGAVIAVLNVLVFSGVLLGSTLGAALGALEFRAPTILLLGGAAALAGSLWARHARAHLEDPLPPRRGSPERVPPG